LGSTVQKRGKINPDEHRAKNTPISQRNMVIGENGREDHVKATSKGAG